MDQRDIEVDTVTRQKGIFNKTLTDNEKEKEADLKDD